MTTNRDRDWVDADGNPIDEEDRGLVYDVRTLVDRRKVLGLFGGMSVAALLTACSPPGPSASSPTTGDASGSTPGSTPSPDGTTEPASEVPDETSAPRSGSRFSVSGVGTAITTASHLDRSA